MLAEGLKHSISWTACGSTLSPPYCHLLFLSYETSLRHVLLKRGRQEFQHMQGVFWESSCRPLPCLGKGRVDEMRVEAWKKVFGEGRLEGWGGS